MYKQLCDEIGDVVARHLGGEDVEADLAAWSRKLGETRGCAIPEDEEDTVSCESAQRLRDIAAALGWAAPSTDGFWHHEAHGPVHDDDLMPFLLDQLRGDMGVEAGAIGRRERAAGETATYKFFKALCDLREQGKIYLHPKGNADPDRPDMVKVGWYDPQSTTIYLVSDLALRQVKAYWRALNNLFDAGTDAVHHDLSQMGCIESSDRGRYTRQVWISAQEKTRRVLVLDAQRVYDKTGFVLSDRVETHPDADGPRQSPSLATMQDLWLEIIRRWWHNGITGEKVVADLLAHREWWVAAIVDRVGEEDGLIRLRDLPDDYWNADTLYILANDGKSRRDLMHLAAGWNPSNVMDIDDPRSMDNTRGKPVVAVWWD